jgi:DNA-binding protein HU-beta
MTKSELVSVISRKTGVGKSEVLKTVEVFMETVKDSMQEGTNVYLRGFGSFVVKKRAAKTARNISKNTSIVIPAHKIPFFKPAKTFINKVKSGNK